MARKAGPASRQKKSKSKAKARPKTGLRKKKDVLAEIESILGLKSGTLR